MATLNFNAHEVEPTSFELVAPGKHPAIIVESEMTPTKAGDGEFLKLELEIIDGPHKGRRLWDRLNLRNPSDEAVKIARATLSAICRAINVMIPTDSDELHDVPLMVQVGHKTRQDTGAVVAFVKGYAEYTGPALDQTEANDDTPPWQKS